MMTKNSKAALIPSCTSSPPPPNTRDLLLARKGRSLGDMPHSSVLGHGCLKFTDGKAGLALGLPVWTNWKKLANEASFRMTSLQRKAIPADFS